MTKLAYEIKDLRAALGESTTAFGARFQRSGRSVEQWEQGRREPDALVLLMVRQLASRRGAKAGARKRQRR